MSDEKELLIARLLKEDKITLREALILADHVQVPYVTPTVPVYPSAPYPYPYWYTTTTGDTATGDGSTVSTMAQARDEYLQ